MTEEQGRRLRRGGALPAGRADRRDRQLPGALDDRAGPRRPGRVPRSSPSIPTPATTAARRSCTATPTRRPTTAWPFDANLARAGVDERVRHVAAFSTAAHGRVAEPDRRAVRRRCPPLRAGPGGPSGLGPAGRRRRDAADPRRVLVDRRHAGHRAGARGRPALPVRRADPLAGRVPGRPRSGTVRLANAARQLAQLPWFARNVALKVLLDRRRLGRVLGDSVARSRSGRTDTGSQMGGPVRSCCAT